ncbi:MurR/RpiR family transcriptional regulator [Trichococcus ilyis]|uniref:Sugar isomerase (Sis) n=1 Tax=Trichococcus ilyis TaxID=640938 RepID=A0A143YMQ7_9LACT|nr:MurR/RpiR family transcriptional regulator [Trichococcus ilyis]CZQ92697.1 sugar isomerase (sis) [Trichococcus ilyis]SEI94332.1 transcriptional regulator, RpiR family [Trichococcus ilyis]
MSLLKKLQAKQNFTDTEERIADYILANLEDVPDMVIQQLADQTFTSHSAIIRLSQKLGFSGYRSFKVALIHDIQSDKHAPTIVDPNFPFLPMDSPMAIAKKMADLTIETVRKTLVKLEKDKLNKAVDLLEKADKIFLFATGDSQIRARSYQNKFIKINKHLIIGDEYGESAWNALSMSKNDCALFISYGGNSPTHKKIIKYLNSMKIPCILLTANTEQETSKLCDLVIEVPYDEFDFFKVGTFSSQISFEYILDTLFSILYAREYTKNLNSLKKKNEAAKKWELL